MAKHALRWYLSRSTILTNKKEADRIAKVIKKRGLKNVSVQQRKFPKTSTTHHVTKGYWIKTTGK